MPLYQDGLFPSGSPVVTINGVTYKANSLTFDKSAETTNINDESGNHAGALQNEGPVTGTMELQFAASNTAIPTTAAENSTTGVCVLPIGAASANVNVFFTSVSVSRPARGPWTATVGFQVKKN